MRALRLTSLCFVILALAGCGDSSENQPDLCFGCYLDGQCTPGDDVNACGQGGGDCAACEGDQVCVDGECHAPSDCPTTCDGCCDENGECRPGSVASECGSGGSFCTACTGDCINGVCEEPCGPANCRGCCSANGECLLFDAQSDGECGAQGEACSDCTTDDRVCGARLIVGGDEDPVTAGVCDIAECDGCTDGCCVQIVGGGVSCEPGDTQQFCGAPGESCRLCDTDTETCQNTLCFPNDDVMVELDIVAMTVPATDPDGDDWDFNSNPDVAITISVAALEAGPFAGTDNTLTPTFFDAAVTVRVDQLLQGFVLTVEDRDTLNPDDPMATLPATGAIVPPLEAFEEFSGFFTHTVGDYEITYQVRRQ